MNDTNKKLSEMNLEEKIEYLGKLIALHKINLNKIHEINLNKK